MNDEEAYSNRRGGRRPAVPGLHGDYYPGRGPRTRPGPDRQAVVLGGGPGRRFWDSGGLILLYQAGSPGAPDFRHRQRSCLRGCFCRFHGRLLRSSPHRCAASSGSVWPGCLFRQLPAFVHYHWRSIQCCRYNHHAGEYSAPRSVPEAGTLAMEYGLD